MKKTSLQDPGIQAIHELRCLAETGDPEAVAAIRDVALYAIDILQNLTLHAFTPDLPASYVEAGKTALKLAKESHAWPVAYHSLKEIRTADLTRAEKLEIGSATGIRLSGKRGLDYSQATGFALDIFRQLDAIRRHPETHRHPAMIEPRLTESGALTPAQNHRTWRHLAAELAPLSKDSLPDWGAAGMEYCRDLCRATPEPCQWRHRAGADGLEINPEDMLADWSKFPWPDCVDSKIGRVTDENGHERTAESAIRGKFSEGLAKLIPL